MYLISFDIGNTSIAAGIFKQDKLIKYWYMPTDTESSVNSYAKSITKKLGNIPADLFSGIIICSVVPNLNSRFEAISKKLFSKKPLFVTHKNCGIRVRYKNKEQVGADRLANAVGGYGLFGGPIIIIDLGTAVTFDCVNKNGDYLGGLILPGIGTSAKALHQFTAKLPLVNKYIAKKIIGKTTIESIQSGLYFGYAGMIKYITEQLKKRLQCSKIIITGGHSYLFSRILKIRAVPELTLIGLKHIFNKNGRKR